MTVVVHDVFLTSRFGWVGGRFVVQAVSSSFTEGSHILRNQVHFIFFGIMYFIFNTVCAPLPVNMGSQARLACVVVGVAEVGGEGSLGLP